MSHLQETRKPPFFGRPWDPLRSSRPLRAPPYRAPARSSLKMTSTIDARMRRRTLSTRFPAVKSHATDHLSALPHPSRDLERDEIEQDERDTQPEERPTLAYLRSDQAEPGEDRGRECDDQTRDLLCRATRAHPGGHDHRDAARCHEIEERQHENGVEQLRREHPRDALVSVAVSGEGVTGSERDGAGGHDREDHPDELAEDDVEVTDRRREEWHERAVLLLRGEGRRDERDSGERREEHALQRQPDEGRIAARARRDPAIRQHEEDRDDDEDRHPQKRRPIQEHLPADLAPRDQPPLHRRASARIARYASSSERSSAESVTTRTPASRSARRAVGLVVAGSSVAKRSTPSPFCAAAASALIPARTSASRAAAMSPANATA